MSTLTWLQRRDRHGVYHSMHDGPTTPGYVTISKGWPRSWDWSAHHDGQILASGSARSLSAAKGIVEHEYRKVVSA